MHTHTFTRTHIPAAYQRRSSQTWKLSRRLTKILKSQRPSICTARPGYRRLGVDGGRGSLDPPPAVARPRTGRRGASDSRGRVSAREGERGRIFCVIFVFLNFCFKLCPEHLEEFTIILLLNFFEKILSLSLPDQHSTTQVVLASVLLFVDF
jgi:hypothetical protein